jgi:non-specific serine/threonine protein kinase/serine/threonine-protein kinase
MDSTRWTQIKDLFMTAFDLPEPERAAFLATCDADLLPEVERLLRADMDAGEFINEPAAVDLGLAEEQTVDPYLGQQIDSYKIVKEIGHGGMGTVYLADHADESFDKQVALKLIKRGMDTNAVLKRFVMERRILAQLQHRFIANLLDGGSTPDGLPYFVMEHVEGLPITKFCASHELSIDERLELFRKVCSAISYAHQNLVVHRDIKPSNIMVTEDGVPKLLDFGIAKLLHSDWSLDTNQATATMFRVLTPEYASPEQMRGASITTTSDVYSLGVVLYELLCGERPFKLDGRMPDEAARIVLTEEPVRPSSVVSSESKAEGDKKSKVITDENNEPPATNNEEPANPRSKNQNLKSLRGDLDNIILKTLAKEPERRYQSVQELSEDIRRHLVGLPVTATADSMAYRLSKFVKRHRSAAIAGGAIILILLAATAVTSWQARVARRERDRADQRFNQVRKLAHTVLFEYHDGIAKLAGSTPLRKKMISDAIEYLDNLSAENIEDKDLLLELADAYEKVGDVQGNPYHANLGDQDGA